MRRIAAVILSIAMIYSCASKKQAVSTLPPVSKKIFDTDIVINYRLLKGGIRDTFNRAIDEIFKERFDMPEYDIKIQLSKPKDASVEIDDKSILVNVPIALQLEKKTFLTTLKANGALEMSFLTDIELDSNWNLTTKTSLSHHRWSEKPKLNVLGVSVPIEAVSNLIIKESKAEIEKNIDESIRQNMTIKEKMLSTVQMLSEPMTSEGQSGAWVQLRPSAFFLSKIENTRTAAKGKILIKGTSTVTTYKPDYTPPKTLPAVHWHQSIPDSSTLRLLADIRMSDVNTLIKENLDGKTFTNDGKSITLSNIITNCDFERFRVVTDVKGTVNGTLIISGKPVYDSTANLFYTKDLDFSFKTKNVIHKAASWIAEGKIKKELSEKMKFSIQEQIQNIQENVNRQVSDYNRKYDIDSKIKISSVKLESFEMKPGIIEAVMKIGFLMETNIHDFRSFNKFNG
jgi:hypothetical protein